MYRIFLIMVAAFFLAPPLWAAKKSQVCVNVSRANLRNGPSLKEKKTWEVNRFMPLMRIGQKGDWLKVQDVDGDIHWVHRSLVTTDFRCVTVKGARANIRKRPANSADMWFSVEKYTSFKYLESGKRWSTIEYEGERMYVFSTLLWPLPPKKK